MFNIYTSINDVLSIYRRNRPLSCVTCRNWDYYVVVTGGKDGKLTGIKMFLKHKNTVENIKKVIFWLVKYHLFVNRSSDNFN